MSGGEYPDQPRVGVGALVIHERQVLLVRRARPPHAGLWAVPGGKLRLGETLQQAAEREVLEETGVVVRAREVLHSFDLIEHDADGRVRFHYVVVDVRAEYVAGVPAGRSDADAARWLAPDCMTSDVVLHPETATLLQRFRPGA